jgi:hypothetical protein
MLQRYHRRTPGTKKTAVVMTVEVGGNSNPERAVAFY